MAIGTSTSCAVFSGYCPRPDGTDVRDDIHVVALSRAHLDALDALVMRDASFVVNLGTGHGYSVLDVARSFEKASDRTVSYEIIARRPRDVVSCFADPAVAKKVIGWRAQYGIERMCPDHWRWQSSYSNGLA